MKRVVKTLPAGHGELYVVSAGIREKIARFSGRVEIMEERTEVPVLGSFQPGVRRMVASFVVCGELELLKEWREDLVHSGKVFEALADVENVRTLFAGLRFTDSDPVSGEWTFAIPDTALIEQWVR